MEERIHPVTEIRNERDTAFKGIDTWHILLNVTSHSLIISGNRYKIVLFQLVLEAGPKAAAHCAGLQAWLLVPGRGSLEQGSLEQGSQTRRRRQVLVQGSQPKKHKGQTQTQFIAFGNGKDGGTAEAIAGADGTSRSTVRKYWLEADSLTPI